MPHIDDKAYRRDQYYRKIMFFVEIVILLLLMANLGLTVFHLSEHWRSGVHVEKGR